MNYLCSQVNDLHLAHRCINCRVKLVGVISIVLVGGFSLFYAVDSTPLRIVGGLFMLAGLATVSSIRTCEKRAAK